jgi:hypothetical protein
VHQALRDTPICHRALDVIAGKLSVDAILAAAEST